MSWFERTMYSKTTQIYNGQKFIIVREEIALP